MNEDELVSTPDDPSALDATEIPASGEEPVSNDEHPVSLEDPEQTPDPVGGDLASDPPLDLPDQTELERLRKELTDLQSELRDVQSAFVRREAEYAEFRELYPDVPLSSLPDAVWEDVRHGIPLTAAFALSERRRIRTEEKAELANRTNRLASAGAVNGSATGFFSAREVRAMSPTEVRENYSQILLSMPKWQ